MEIEDVSDTALWVATYRAVESERPDALFKDPFAGPLAGEKGRQIAANIAGTDITAWAIVIRTWIIDGYIRALAPEVDVVLNLGAGLDARPYRLDLPPGLRWVEVDYPHMIRRKEEALAGETPRCRLERVGLDLADRPARAAFLAGFASARVLVLTEGVIPYLADDEVASLADDLRQAGVRLWIVDYLAREMLALIHRGRRRRQMKNAPLRFAPADWFEFFAARGWTPREIRYPVLESEKLGRPVPRPWWALLLALFTTARSRERYRRLSGYVLLEP